MAPRVRRVQVRGAETAFVGRPDFQGPKAGHFYRGMNRRFFDIIRTGEMSKFGLQVRDVL